MAWGFWSAASAVTDRGRSPRRATTTSNTGYYQSHQQQFNIPTNKCVQQEDTKSNYHMTMIPAQQQTQQQKQSAVNSVCGSPCQSTCHSPTCNSPSCSVTTGIKLLLALSFFISYSI